MVQFLLLAILILFTDKIPLMGADISSLPGQGFEANHYRALWTKSPFAVASPEPGEQPSDYSLVGVAKFDGVSYASIVDKQSLDHFIVATNKPEKNLTLVSITRGNDASSTYANLQKEGQVLTLKLEAPSAEPGQTVSFPVGANGTNVPPPVMNPNPMMNPNVQPVFNPPINRFQPPQVFNRSRIIHVPPPPPTTP